MSLLYSAVLSNPDFESASQSFWYAIKGDNGMTRTTSAAGQPSNSGAYHHWRILAAQPIFGHMYVPSTDILGGNVFARGGFYTNLYVEYDWVMGFILCLNNSAEVLNAAMAPVNTTSTEIFSQAPWRNIEMDCFIPSETTSIYFGWQAQNVGGTYNYVHLDDFYLDFYTASEYLYPVHLPNNQFMSGNSFWTQTSGNFSVRSSSPPSAPMWLAPYPAHPYNSTDAFMNMYQDITIVDTNNVLTNWVDAGSAMFKSSFAGATIDTTSANGRIQFASVFLSGSDTVLGSIANASSPEPLGAITSLWVATGMMPTGTRKIRYECNRAKGTTTFDRTEFSMPFGQILLPQDIASPVPSTSGNTTTTLEAFVAQFNFVTTSAMLEVPTSLGMSSEPKWIFGFTVNAITPDYGKFDKNISYASYAYSTDGSSKNNWATFFLDYAGTGRYSWASETILGPGPATDTGNGIYRNAIRSVAPGYITWQARSTGNNAASYCAGQFTLTGSISVHVGVLAFDARNVGSVSAASFGFQPDLLLFTGANRQNNIAGNSVAFCAPSVGFVDCRSLRHLMISEYAYNGPSLERWPLMFYSNSYMGLVVQSASYNYFGTAVHVNSRATWGYTLIVDSDTLGETVTSYAYPYTAIKFDDPQINFRVDYLTLIGSQSVQSVQTNSLNPQFIIINGLNVKTEDYSTNIDGVITDYLSSAERVFGFVHSDEVVGMVHGGLSSASSWRDASLISATGISFYDSSNGVSATLRSWNTATGGFSYWQARTVDINSYDGMKISYCAVGVAANAPGHFMGQDGQSVFLTNNEFGDDLLLSGGAAGGGGGPSSPPPGGGGGNAVGNREFWTDIDRDFPTQINTIRDFPIY